jgi:hypothetical protein
MSCRVGASITRADVKALMRGMDEAPITASGFAPAEAEQLTSRASLVFGKIEVRDNENSAHRDDACP